MATSARKTSIDAAAEVTEALIRKLQACDFQFPCEPVEDRTQRSTKGAAQAHHPKRLI